MTSESDDAPLLLDTHCWVWLQSGELQRFSTGSVAAIERAAQSGLLRVSVISVWEIALLESKGRVQMHMDCMEWVRRALETPGLTLVPLTPEIAVESTRLPGEFHADPADRILVATARNIGAPLLTRDRALIAYGRKRHARIMAA
ncbi:MAG TPA: type II toxin-antitoxin system VapC family toxin [Bryobacteraceae bacterium]|nr:type II toxin-antitoxin system VapC family toxin [Bryobacteraceae bacterium]